jgi:hypothetical protein
MSWNSTITCRIQPEMVYVYISSPFPVAVAEQILYQLAQSRVCLTQLRAVAEDEMLALLPARLHPLYLVRYLSIAPGSLLFIYLQISSQVMAIYGRTDQFFGR